LALISTLVSDNTRVLDVGCGDGALLELLAHERGVDGRGIELSQAGVNRCVARGLSVIQGDADTDLSGYPDGAFDYVILSQTIQQARQPAQVLKQMLRIGKHAIVSFPNFAHWRMRLNLLLLGRMPRTNALPYSWYETPNIHQCTLADFELLCRDMHVRIERSFSVWHGPRPGTREMIPQSAWSNLTAEEVLFLLSAS
jgi:methionine biosynthesis protein MetW